MSAENSKLVDYLHRNGREALNKGDLLLSDEWMRQLAMWGIFLAPAGDEDVELEDLPKYTQGKTLGQVLTIFKSLASRFQNFADIQDAVRDRARRLSRVMWSTAM